MGGWKLIINLPIPNGRFHGLDSADDLHLGFIATSLNASFPLHSLVFNYIYVAKQILSRFPFVSRKQVDIAKPVITKKN